MADSCYQLDVSGETVVENPDIDRLKQLICEHMQRDDFFAVLQRREQHYMQTTRGSDPGTFVLEVREGSRERHRQCVDRALSKQAVLAAMTSYLTDDENWRHSLSWEPLVT